MGMERVKNHFDSSAADFDMVIQKLIPFYDKMVRALVAVIPFKKTTALNVMDLGCGTGTIAGAVKKAYPNARITCLDISQNMLQMAKSKLGESCEYIEGNLENFEFVESCDLIVSSLALHHLESDEKLTALYQKIYRALGQSGIFINIDVVLGSDSNLQESYMAKWQEFMEKSLDKAEIQNKVLVDYYAEDRPVRLTQHLQMLASCGFSCIDVPYKYYNFAVMFAKK